MQQLFSEWTTYEKVVANDYMHHREYFSALAEYLGELPGPLEVVDLGCGDARPVEGLLKQLDIQSYVGIDQSSVALDIARQVLDSNGIHFELNCVAMQDGIQSLAGPVDLVIASYSLHHLSALEKQQMLKECRRLLRPGGVLAIVDVFREEAETRAEYLERWQRHAREYFEALSAEELESLIEHVMASDHPESLEDYRRFGSLTGFGETKLLRESEERLNKLVLLA